MKKGQRPQLENRQILAALSANLSAYCLHDLRDNL